VIGSPSDVDELIEELDEAPRFIALLDDRENVERQRPTLERAAALVERTGTPPLGLGIVIENALRTNGAEAHVREQPALEFVTVSRAGRLALREALAAAPSAAPLLIVGEDGAGKRTLARSAHAWARRSGACVEIEIQGSLFAEIAAAVERVDPAGTVILAGVDALVPESQKWLADRIAAGGALARVVSTARPAIREKVQSGGFSRDLFFRLSPLIVDLPPLRARKDDIALLAHLFLRRAAERFAISPKRFSREALSVLRAWPFPDNASELEAVVVRALTSSSQSTMTPRDLGLPLAGSKPDDPETLAYTVERDRALRAFERAYVERVLSHAGGNVSQAARLAGMDPANMRRLVRRVKGTA
ncbi:MAG: hypothetical protein HOV80_14395, partial [Polyangiaceae bacterium]|nr:hypothetical protein [Polyangiaceae bacterium]